MNLTVASGGGIVNDSIQGTMTFNLGGGISHTTVDLRQIIVPQPGNVFFSNNWAVAVWADQPLAGPLMVDAVACTFFATGGDCRSSDLIVAVPYLGANPDLANAGHLSVSRTGEVSILPGTTLPPGTWENIFDLNFSGGTGSNHVRIAVVQGDATFRNGAQVPEPATIGELGIGFAIILVVAYRRQRLSRNRATATQLSRLSL